MTPLACLTRGDSSPRGKARVYFCCHPDDQSAFLKPVAGELLALHDCAVWYDPEPGAPLSPDRREELAQMQLFVVPVTSRFLTIPSPALTEEFPLAMERHIPVLPLLQEPGLESIFNEKCGDLQCLDPNQADPTALPYEEKLKKFLDGVLVGDELAAQVRAAFDAYIFLSYRKKDREKAQALMRLIHKNDFCRDIAIWYDEFLTPGEDFNAAITQALEKSDLFVLSVTPHLLEKPNYVMTEEFPRARDAGKLILPVEMDPTDRAGLEAAYPGIPPCSSTSFLEFHYKLRALLPELANRERPDDPSHNYFIGLAYLTGIDVEVDKKRGASLIQSAARDSLPEAMEKLVIMYRTGDGVQRDYRRAAEWQRNLADARRNEWENKQDEAAYIRYANALWNLGDQYQELFDLANARKVWETEFLPLVNRGVEQGLAPARRYRSVSCSKLGEVCQAAGDLAAAHRLFEESRALTRALAVETGTVQARRDLSVSYNNLGKVCQAEGDLPAARRWFEESLELRRALAEKIGTVQARRDLAISYERLGNLCRAEGNLPAARRWFEEGLELDRALVAETGTVQARRDLAVNCNRLGYLCRAEGDLPAARRWFEESLELDRALAAETGTVQARRNLALSCGWLGEVCRAEGDLAAAHRLFEESQALHRALVTEIGMAESRRDLMISCEQLGALCWKEGDLRAARRWFEEGLALRRALTNETCTAETRRDLAVSCERLGEVCRAAGDLRAARRRFEEGLALRRALAKETGTAETRRDLAVSCSKLGEVCQAAGDLPAARRWFEESLELRRDLASKLNTCQSQNDLAVSLYKLGTLPDGNKDLLLEAIDIWTRLSREYPDRPEFAQYRIHTCVEYTMRSPLGKFLKWLQRKFSKDTKDSR